MGKYCYCPTAFNVFSGLFMVSLSILAFFNILEISMPTWLSIIVLTIGIFLVFLNSVNTVHEKVSGDLSTEKANRIHAREGY